MHSPNSTGPLSRLRSWCARAAIAATVIAGAAALAQPLAPPNGPRLTDPAWHALVNATLVPEPGAKIENCTIVFRDGVIVSVSPGGTAPAGARVWDCAGLTVYPGLIEPYFEVEAPKPDSNEVGAHWNAMVTAQRNALDGEGITEKDRKSLREMGYTSALASPKDGVFRGTAAYVSLAESPDASRPASTVRSARAFHAVSLDTSSFGRGTYPSSKMGAIALVRQTLADAGWHSQQRAFHRQNPAQHAAPEPSNALTALAEIAPILFEVDEELDVLRVATIAQEYAAPHVIVGSGTEFRRIDAVAKAAPTLIVPLAFPETPKVGSPGEREAVDLRTLMTWEAAPSNPARLESAGVRVALTTSKLPKGQKFFDNLREAIKAGLSEDDALAMLTTNPAMVLGLQDRVGKVTVGAVADLVVVKGSLFDKDREIRDVWIDGVRHEVNPAPTVELDGDWDASFALDSGVSATLKVADSGKKITLERAPTPEELAKDAEKSATPDANRPVDAAKDATPKPKKFTARGSGVRENRVSFQLDGAALGAGDGVVTLSAIVEDSMIGSAALPNGTTLAWSATRVPKADAGASKKDEADDSDEEKDAKGDAARYAGIPERFGLPFGPFAFDEPPAQPAYVVIKNATIWTSGPDGIIEGGDLVVRDGKINYVGPTVNRRIPDGAVVIDAAGKHVTPGLIDCHSHTGISGSVNEGTQAVTAEVRIGDVVDPDDVAWYRELAGGLTAVNQLHGSANPIGGQNSVVKIRWGAAHPDDMKIDGAIAGIKFALGENVKQSNWGDNFRTRYPQTRMGVETIIRDRFTAAREYGARWNAWKQVDAAGRARTPMPRRDLELEALAEILAGDRLVHCHSYRQDEILMLCRVAEDYGFKIGTFQHVLEGYKVAEAIREHAIGGSAFSDWWAYKFEVIDAIPEAGAIMYEAGVNVSFNSDSDELARRMNIEAAKAVKYGGVPREEALKFLTLNPAKQLKIDDRTGSLEEDKDADFVIWSGDPLSTFSRCESTWIDGREYFSLERDRALREQVEAERARIIQKVLASGSKKPGDRDGAPAGRRGREMVDTPPTLLDRGLRGGYFVAVGGPEEIDRAREDAALRALESEFNWLILNGFDPYTTHRGACGCSSQCFFNAN